MLDLYMMMKAVTQAAAEMCSLMTAESAEITEASRASAQVAEASRASTEVTRGISILDCILRIVAILGTLGSAIAMGTTDQTLPIFNPFTQFRAAYNDLPAFTFFVIANSIACAYLVFSLPITIFHVVKSAAKNSMIILIIFDTAMLALLSAGASAAAAVVYIVHKGNASANWFALCQQFNTFCYQISGSLIGSFVAVIVFMLLIITSAVAISRV